MIKSHDYLEILEKKENFGMKLTRRQEEFISKLLDLHEEFDGPIHYSVLAERLGVSPFTAYDMLCVLEEKGYVTSQYQLGVEKSGPGRAERVFFPVETIQAREKRLAEQLGDEGLMGESLKVHILEKLRSGDVLDKELTDQMLARIPPEAQGKIRYCIEVMTVVWLRIRNGETKDLFTTFLPHILQHDSPTCRADLTFLGGISFGLLAQDSSVDQEWVRILFEHIKYYQDIVVKLARENCRQLADYLILVFQDF